MNEIVWDANTLDTLYFCKYASNGEVYLTDGLSSEVWGTGGRDASDYAVSMPQVGVGGHFVGHFDETAVLSIGVYPVTVYLQIAGSPDDEDIPVANGDMAWNGIAEVTKLAMRGGNNWVGV